MIFGIPVTAIMCVMYIQYPRMIQFSFDVLPILFHSRPLNVKRKYNDDVCLYVK